MNLYLLKNREDLEPPDDPWEPWYDKCFGFVVAATSEEEARRTALESEETGDEVYVRSQSGTHFRRENSGPHAWLEAKYSTCELVGVTDIYEKPTVLLYDFHSA